MLSMLMGSQAGLVLTEIFADNMRLLDMVTDKHIQEFVELIRTCALLD